MPAQSQQTPTSTEWLVVLGDATKDPQLLLSIDGSHPAPFQLRGFDYSPVTTCCRSNDAAPFQKPIYTRDIPRMASMGANVIKIYGMCDEVLAASNEGCGPPEPGCERDPVTVKDVLAFLDFCLSHRIFVLLANRATMGSSGDVGAYKHMAATYGKHPAVAGAILFDETLDLVNFNAAAKELHEGFAKVLGKDPSNTPAEMVGRIITTAAQAQVLSVDFHKKYGEHLNSWGWDPYSEWSYANYGLKGVPFKPFFLTENGFNGAGNAGCRTDCTSSKCTPCTDFADSWKSYVQWLSTARIAGHFVFEWTDENWKGGDSCKAQELHSDKVYMDHFNEGNHGIFHAAGENTVRSPGVLVAKSIGGGATFESVLKDSWTKDAPGTGGFRGWL